tara:strand:- start:6617 stop:7015 length:399 start_codon:yes stop_codon:yes gene_type:complete
MTKPIVKQIEQEQIRSDIVHFDIGDTIEVNVRVVEGTRERTQVFGGVVIAKRNRGFNSSFTVRKVSYGEGVERVFPLHGNLVKSVTIKRRGDVRRAKLYYLRQLSGKAARIKDKIIKKTKVAATTTEVKTES